MRNVGASLRLVAEHVGAGDEVIEVLPAVADLFPRSGLPRGDTLHIRGSGARSLLFSVLVRPTVEGAWVAMVGFDDLGLSAAHDLGIALERVVVIDMPPTSNWSTVIGALIGSFDLVVIAPSPGAGKNRPAKDGRRLRARARERRTMLMQLGGTTSVWGERAGLEMDIIDQRWEGLGVGHGHLTARRVTVAVTGRRGAERPRRIDLWLPDRYGKVAIVDPLSVSDGYAGSDTDKLIDEHAVGVFAHEHAG